MTNDSNKNEVTISNFAVFFPIHIPILNTKRLMDFEQHQE
jgi:hypothetical protein